MRKIVAASLGLMLIGASAAHADCVVGASMATRFQAIDSDTIMLISGGTPKILVQVFCCVYSSSSVTVLKDSFCSYEDAVLLIDGEAHEARQVKSLY